MKRLSSLLAVALLTVMAAPCRVQAATRPSLNDDTIMVKLPNQATMTLVTKNKAQLRQLRTYHLDSLMILLDKYIAQAEAASQNADNKAVTMEFYPDKDHPGTNAPEQVRITVRAEDAKSTTKGNRFIKVSVGDDEKGETVKINLGDSASDSARTAKSKRKREENANKTVHSNFNVDLGLNALVNRSPWRDISGQEQTFDLKPLGSRYVALTYHYDIRVGGKGSPFHLITGPELAFNNYMFEKNRRLTATDTRTDILREPILGLEKSKLAVTTINLPLLAELSFRDKKGNKAFRIGGGGYAGYRLSSHTKIKYESEGTTRKDKDRGSFNLEDFQYGLQGGIGVHGVDLFVKYGLNDLFKDNRGPKGQTISFGVSI
ncbi:Outer membrane protein beta-barrel domain-containing protein [Hymenobacter daecheongensis DSM 21074]|uniref:Outer membrane protein beta-barrel domain-containing protein n=1 Tax=Hymenobacter daecheongensis DSM 21074 TaxID=1121955 RepID=A0A1M6JWZ1_9BACT|nr:porin family protein [Hymenobacter daecheongensis]SHJ51186.1 Outer membrane protein beta-barrel domain-containing protein [Hymenobacter daecheongensis DSM 21074]